MKKLLTLLALALLAPMAQAQIEWRVSVKMILDANENRPPTGNFITDEQVSNTVRRANEILDATGRGYRYKLTEITNAAGISRWFNSDRTNSTDLEAAAESSKFFYLYRDNAINVYINGWDGTAICSYPHSPDGSNDIIFMGQGSFLTSFAHEAGHYFDLRHTFEGEAFLNSDNSPCTANDCSCALWMGGNGDLITDTRNDHECWTTQNHIAGGNYGVNYGSPGSDDAAVDRIFFNLMSYRTDVRDRFTEDQMDRMADTSNDSRFKVANGRTRFVAGYGNDATGNGSSNNRYRTVAKGVAESNPGDIVLLAGGNYSQPQTTITNHVTLRATRGNVTIGQP